MSSALQRRLWVPVALSYATFILVGVSAGVVGVLLPAQIDDYGVDKTTIGTTFFTSSAGFMLAGFNAGPLIHRFGVRTTLLIGCCAYILAGLITAARPPFLALVAIQLIIGYGTGLAESVLNVYLAGLPGATTLLNRLHAFFGVGALLGPLLATWMLGYLPWTAVWLVLALAALPLMAGFRLILPAREVRGTQEAPEPGRASGRTASGRGLLGTASREPAVLLGATFLAVYVGLEISVGNWGFSFLVDARGQGDLLAGYTVSAYWLGLTLGRFLISPAAARLGVTDIGMTFLCLAGVTTASMLAWSLPGAVSAVVSFVLLGFFLGPIFPTTMAVAPRLTVPRLVPTAIGLLNGVSVVGGAVFPWLAGTIAEGIGPWTLPPFTAALALLQIVLWWLVSRRMATPSAEPRPSHTEDQGAI